MEVTRKVEVVIPTLPDRLKIEGGKRASLPIEELEEGALQAIASQVVKDWLKRAEMLRGQPARAGQGGVMASVFTDRRSLAQIGGWRAYWLQVSWSLKWRWRWRRCLRRWV